MHAFVRNLACATALVWVTALSVVTAPTSVVAQTPWEQSFDRVWLGADYWANPMEDWRVVDGEAECTFGGGGRNVQLLTHQLTDPSKPFEMSVRVRLVEAGPRGGGAGFRVGVRSDINEYRSNCFAPGGIDAGIRQGQLALGSQTGPLSDASPDQAVVLTLSGEPEGDGARLTLVAKSEAGEIRGQVSQRFPADRLLGNVALVNNYAQAAPRAQVRQAGLNRYRFSKWVVGGEAFSVHPEHRFGPLLWSMYTLSDSRSEDGFVLKLTALTGPLGERDNRQVELQLRDGESWKSVGRAELDRDAWTATFRIARWDATEPKPYRLVYVERHRDGGETMSYREGEIRANPVDRPLRVASLTCQNDYAFPYQPVADNLRRLDPDLLYFSGDQLYENHGGFGIIRSPAEPAILNYLRKYYQFGWAFGDIMRSRPTVVLPDDHDVFQGNVWGEAGAAMDFSVDPQNPSRGGYHQPARMVNVVHATCTSHHPDFPDRDPVKQDISVYHGDLVYGGVSFAIIADRQFKSGPERVQVDGPRADHVVSPDFDTATLDQPGLVLLGERQEDFLRQWSQDWRGHGLKVLLSQTVFGAAATHHGTYDGYLKADLDSGSWPQTPRHRALRALSGSMALHLNGDQHLTSLVQYGIERQRDSIWSFCAPAIAVGYPRWWRPDELGLPHDNRPRHGLPNTGEYLDGFGNRIYVYAIGNPEVGTERDRYRLAHQKGSGFAMVTMDTEAKTYKLEAFRFLVDATDGNPANQFPGWPLTLHQNDNGVENRVR
jgi:alkaline phosphatase D